jgi:RNA polymerase sigma-70 factor (ECF subfamily)
VPPDAADLGSLYRAEWGRLLSALIRDFEDFDLAEEALQEAFASAVREWSSSGRPSHPRAWLYAAARHNALDQVRRQARFSGKREALLRLASLKSTGPQGAGEDDLVPDERLRLIFTCCHPALAAEAQVALTLREVCGLTTDEIARAFLVPSSTMAQRLVRAKAKIRGAVIPYQVPPASELPGRLAEVMAVLYLVFNEGYSAARGRSLVREELSAESIRLARLLREELPSSPPELDGLLALMLLHDARRGSRVDEHGELVLLEHQDRTRWDRAQIDEGARLVEGALRSGPAGPYALEAAIAAVHADAAGHGDTDWVQIAGIYGRLYALHPSPVVGLNRAVAVSMADGPEAALPLVERLGEELPEYHLWHAARADLLRRLGRRPEALESYERARSLSQNDVERRFLERRIAELSAT